LSLYLEFVGGVAFSRSYSSLVCEVLYSLDLRKETQEVGELLILSPWLKRLRNDNSCVVHENSLISFWK